MRREREREREREIKQIEVLATLEKQSTISYLIPISNLFCRLQHPYHFFYLLLSASLSLTHLISFYLFFFLLFSLYLSFSLRLYSPLFSSLLLSFHLFSSLLISLTDDVIQLVKREEKI